MSDTEELPPAAPEQPIVTEPPVGEPEQPIVLPPPVGLTIGDTTQGVFDLQIRIGASGTGVYDAETEQAVKALQAEWGMAVTGIADDHVHARLGLPWMQTA